LLLAPAALLYGAYIIDNIAYISLSLGWRKLPSANIPILQHPFPVDLLDVVRYIFVFALLIFLVRRFSLARQEETRLSTEMGAARSVQSLLVPVTPPATPGFVVESVYIPASEVGGDFFQVLPGDDGSLLIVVGDVSGKGLKAAMTVSVIVGALRGCTQRAPAAVLAHLNRVLFGQIGGFVTCCATLIAADSAMTIANAGHLSPYLNGEEMRVQSGLPLGITGEATCEETICQLSPGDRLTYVSDGVVEARSKSGELFGFERTAAAAAGGSTESIAEAAQRFGQDDDITVISIARTAALEPVTV
jgi:serine phosphatase RsbU (regulator of sigma subunit)